jgi:uncharacterized protein
MKILVDVAHPAHVHFFRNAIKRLQEKGHVVKVTAKHKEVTLKLLDYYGFDYVSLGMPEKSLLGKAYAILKFDYKTYKIAKEFKPDLYVSLNSPYMAHASKLMGKPHIAFEDTEDAKFVFMLSNPFTEVICTPECFKKDFGKKHVRFRGYKELAYLHPNQFKPDPSVLDHFGLKEGDRFMVLRFISWAAHHDVGLSGINEASELVRKLEEHGRVLITSEKPLPAELEKNRITCSPERIHSLLYYSQLYIGEGGTTAVEAAVLGTPAIHIEANSKGIATGFNYGNFTELKDKYGLLDFYPGQEQAFKRAVEILGDNDSKKLWAERREKLLADKIDVTAWMTDFIERYPKSFEEYRKKA